MVFWQKKVPIKALHVILSAIYMFYENQLAFKFFFHKLM